MAEASVAIPKERKPIVRAGEKDSEVYTPFLKVDVKSGEILLDRRSEVCPWFLKEREHDQAG